MMFRRLIAAAALLALAAGGAEASGASGQDGKSARGQLEVPIVGGFVRADTSFKALTMDADGNVKTVNAAPPADQNARFTSIISNAALAYNAGDSSAVLNVHGLRHMKLLIKVVPASTGLDTTSISRLAFQIRTHLNGQSDSSSTFAEYAFGISTLGGGAAAGNDSLITGQLLKGGKGGAVGQAWSGEFVVAAMSARAAHANSIAVTGHEWYYPSGMAIPLDSMFGRDFWGDYISVRVRNLTGNTCAVTVHLVGTPL